MLLWLTRDPINDAFQSSLERGHTRFNFSESAIDIVSYPAAGLLKVLSQFLCCFECVGELPRGIVYCLFEAQQVPNIRTNEQARGECDDKCHKWPRKCYGRFGAQFSRVELSAD